MSQERPTMLNRDELDYVDMSELYRLEVSRLPDITKLSEKQRWRLVARARAKEEQARNDLLLCCLGHVFQNAVIVQAYHQPSQDVLDLVQEGNLAMLQVLENALASSDPIVVLCASAKRAMVRPSGSALGKSRGRRG